MQFAPLHNHSEYSALDGFSTCEEIAERCVELGCPCCGITDHGTVAGHLEFAKALAKRDIKPIFGTELYHGVKPKGYKGWTRNERDQAHLVVGAMTNEGLRNLWRLNDIASQNFRYVGRVTWDDLEGYSDGLFCTTACIASLVSSELLAGHSESLNKYVEIFKDNLYVELHTYPSPDQEQINLALCQIATERGLPVVYANDAHFAYPGQYAQHDAYVAMQTGESIDTPINDRKMWHPFALYMMDETEIRNHLHYLPDSVVDEALSNTVALGSRCNVSLPSIKPHLPIFIPKHCEFVPEHHREDNASKLFIDLVENGLKDRYGEDAGDEVWQRANKEMEAFFAGGLHHYFLQAWDFCQFCDANGIERGPGRGSAAGALVSYALGITDVDPLRYQLSFERFWNAGRAKGFPDIDNDFPVYERERIKEYLTRRWGGDNVRSIGTVTRLKPKAALDKTYRVFGVEFQEKESIKKIVNTVPDLNILGADSVGWKDDGGGKTIYVWSHVGRQIKQYVEQRPPDRQTVLWKWLDFVEAVCSRVSGYGVHASGVVVSDVPLSDELPSFWSATGNTQATMFPMADVDKRGFIKQDILGLRNLDTLQEWKRLVKLNHGIDIKWSGLEAKQHPLEMWEMLDKGLTTGVFQIETSPPVRKLTMEFKPRSVEDLSVIVALNRPGPLRSGTGERFVARRNGLEPIQYDHPFLEDILDETYGLFLYQEQVIALFSKLGLSESDADAIRKVLGKKNNEDWQAVKNGEGEWQDKGFFDLARRVMDEGSAQVIWNRLEEFAKYSFNKSHSIAYATIAFRTLYAKYYAPTEFIMACIRTNNEDAALYVAEGRRIGVPVLPPDIRKSGAEVGVTDGAIYYGLANVKGVGLSSARYLSQLVKTHSCFTPADVETALEVEDAAWRKRKEAHQANNVTAFRERSPRSQCRSNIIEALERVGAFDNYKERTVSLAEQQAAETELLGIVLSDNTQEALDRNSDLVEECDDYQEFIDSISAGARAKLAGIVSNIRPTQTKATGSDMAIVTIEMGQDNIEFAVFPRQWESYKFLWKERTAGIFNLKKSDRGTFFEDGIKL